MRRIIWVGSVIQTRNRQARTLDAILIALLLANLGISNIQPGYWYTYTSTSYFGTPLVILLILVGLFLSMSVQMYCAASVTALLFLSIVSLLITELLASVGGASALSATAGALIPLGMLLLGLLRGSLPRGRPFLYWYLAIYSTWLSLQTVTVATAGFSRWEILKDTLIVSIGGSNYIAAHLVVCVTFFSLAAPIRGRVLHWIILGIGGVGLLFTASFGALVSLLFVLSLALVTREQSSRLSSAVALLGLLAAAWGLHAVSTGELLPQMDSSGPLQDVLKLFSQKLKYWDSGNYSRLLADRDVIYEAYFQTFLEHPVLGSGSYVSLQGVETRAHDWILECLAVRGLVGLLLFGSAVGLVLLRIRSRGDRLFRAIKYSLMVAAIHGLVEPNFFSRQFDVLWWLMAGVGLALVQGEARTAVLAASQTDGCGRDAARSLNAGGRQLTSLKRASFGCRRATARLGESEQGGTEPLAFVGSRLGGTSRPFWP